MCICYSSMLHCWFVPKSLSCARSHEDNFITEKNYRAESLMKRCRSPYQMSERAESLTSHQPPLPELLMKTKPLRSPPTAQSSSGVTEEYHPKQNPERWSVPRRHPALQRRAWHASHHRSELRDQQPKHDHSSASNIPSNIFKLDEPQLCELKQKRRRRRHACCSFHLLLSFPDANRWDTKHEIIKKSERWLLSVIKGLPILKTVLSKEFCLQSNCGSHAALQKRLSLFDQHRTV